MQRPVKPKKIYPSALQRTRRKEQTKIAWQAEKCHWSSPDRFYFCIRLALRVVLEVPIKTGYRGPLRPLTAVFLACEAKKGSRLWILFTALFLGTAAYYTIGGRLWKNLLKVLGNLLCNCFQSFQRCYKTLSPPPLPIPHRKKGRPWRTLPWGWRKN